MRTSPLSQSHQCEENKKELDMMDDQLFLQLFFQLSVLHKCFKYLNIFPMSFMRSYYRWFLVLILTNRPITLWPLLFQPPE